MYALKIFHLLLLNIFFFIACGSESRSSWSCGKIRIQTPFLRVNSTVSSTPLDRLVLCRSQKLYLRTSLGLFPISSIDYESKTLTISSHSPCSSSRSYLSPSLLLAGFPSPPQPNSVLLFNCSNHKNHPFSSLARNCSRLNVCAASSITRGPKQEAPYSCLIVDDVENLDKGFHPKDLRCSHYIQVHKSSSNNDNNEGYKLGTRISFDIPDHVPNLCDECEKPNGNCGIGLRCVCHPQECKDKVISIAGSLKKPYGRDVIFSVLYAVLVLLFMNMQCWFFCSSLIS